MASINLQLSRTGRLGTWLYFGQVGTAVGNQLLELDEYERVERLYMDFILACVRSSGIERFKVFDLEIHDPSLDGAYSEGQWISGNSLEDIIRRNLREEIWCRLQDEAENYVHFGWDYCVYLGLPMVDEKVRATFAGIGFDSKEQVSPYISNG